MWFKKHQDCAAGPTSRPMTSPVPTAVYTEEATHSSKLPRELGDQGSHRKVNLCRRLVLRLLWLTGESPQEALRNQGRSRHLSQGPLHFYGSFSDRWHVKETKVKLHYWTVLPTESFSVLAPEQFGLVIIIAVSQYKLQNAETFSFDKYKLNMVRKKLGKKPLWGVRRTFRSRLIFAPDTFLLCIYLTKWFFGSGTEPVTHINAWKWGHENQQSDPQASDAGVYRNTGWRLLLTQTIKLSIINYK